MSLAPRRVVRVSARILHWPNECACCGGPPETSLGAVAARARGQRVVRVSVRSWQVPHCFACCQHIRLAAAADGWLIGGILLAAFFLFVALLLLLLPFALIGWSLIGASLFAATQRARSSRLAEAYLACSPCCCDVRSTVRYLGWYGTVHTFHFSNSQFADAFEDANRKKIVL